MNAVRSAVEGSVGGICRIRDRRTSVACRYAGSVGSVVLGSELGVRCKLPPYARMTEHEPLFEVSGDVQEPLLEIVHELSLLLCCECIDGVML